MFVSLDPERVKTLENEKKRIRDAQQKKYEEQAKKTMAERKKAKRAKALEKHEKKKFIANDHDHFDSEYNPLMGGSSGRCVKPSRSPLPVRVCTQLRMDASICTRLASHFYIHICTSSSRVTRRVARIPPGGGG